MIHGRPGRDQLSKLEQNVDVRQAIEDGEGDRGGLLYAVESQEGPLEAPEQHVTSRQRLAPVCRRVAGRATGSTRTTRHKWTEAGSCMP